MERLTRMLGHPRTSIRPGSAQLAGTGVEHEERDDRLWHERRLVLADDHALVRVGLREVLEVGAASRSSGRPRTAPRPWTQAAVRAIELGVVKPGSLSAG